VRAIAQDIEVRLPGSKQTGDDQIAKRALDILAWSTSIPRDAIQVKVQKGWVTLSGKVNWYYQKMNALNLVSKLSGVTGITSLIEIEPRVQAVDIKMSIEKALKRNAQTEASGIRVAVEGTKVTLDGRVHGWHERDEAERAAWSVPGVRHVVDNIVLG
jgi:osmotically-inducible protein OsmY